MAGTAATPPRGTKGAPSYRSCWMALQEVQGLMFPRCYPPGSRPVSPARCRCAVPESIVSSEATRTHRAGRGEEVGRAPDTLTSSTRVREAWPRAGASTIQSRKQVSLQGPRLAVAGLGVVPDQPPTRSSPGSSTPSTCAGKELGFRAFLGSGGGIRTRDLRVMSCEKGL